MSGNQFQFALVFRAETAAGKAGLTDLAGAMQQVSAAGSGVSASARKQEADLQAMAAATAKAVAGQDQLVAAEKRAQEARAKVLLAPLANAGASMSPMVASFKATDTAAASLQGSVRGLTATIGLQAQELVETASASRAYRAALDDIRAGFNPVFAAQLQYEQQLKRIDAAQEMTALSAEEAAAARLRAAQILAAQQARGGGANAYTANIGAQGFDIGVTAMMGMDPAMIGFQQGSQLAGIAMQMGGGAKAAKEMVLGLLSILNPTTLVTIGLTTLAAVGIQALMGLSEKTKSWDEQLGDLDETLGRMKTNLDRVGNTRLSDTFGNLTGDVRGLAQGLLELGRAAELKSLQGVVDGFLKNDTSPTIGDLFFQSFNPGGAMGAPPLTTEQLSAARYAELGAANSFADFSARTAEISNLAKSGDINGVTAELLKLQSAMSGGKGVSAMSETLRSLLAGLAEAGIKTAEIEALWNGSARAEAQKRSIDQMVLGYQQEAELQTASLQFGSDSAEIDQIRARHARELLEIRLEELGVEKDSAEWLRAINGLLGQQEAIEAAHREAAKDRVRDQQDRLAGITREIGLIGASNAERLRANALAEAEIEIRKNKLGLLAAEEQRTLAIAKAEEEARLARDKALYDIDITGRMDGFDARIAGERNPQIRIAIEAEKEYARQIAAGADAQVAAAAAAQVRTRALVDLRQEQTSFLRGQEESIRQSQLELALMGQTAEVRARILALVQAERDILRLGVTGGDAELIRKNALAQADLARQIEAQADAWKTVQSAGEAAIDSVLDKLRAGDIKGAFRDLLAEIEQGFFDLAIRNPLKNAIFGTNLGTWDDVGGWSGIWGRLSGQNPVDERSLVAQAVAPLQSMTVTAVNVMIGGPGAAAFLQSAGRGSLGGGFSGLGGSNDIQSQIWAFFTAKGLAPHQIAAIMGNISAESGFHPLAVGDGGTSYGLFQHHAGRGMGLLSAVGGQGGLGDIEAQLAYVWQELLTSENGVLQRLLASGNLYEATGAFVGYERPQGWSPGNPQGSMHWDQRLAAAEAAMAQFEGQVYATGQGVNTLGTGAAAMGQSMQGFGVRLQGLIMGIGAQYGPLGSFAGGLLSSILGGLPGFDRGGHTGTGADTDVAGIVHAEEFVFDARATRRIGVRNLEAIRRGSMPGYLEGGHVVSGGLPLAPMRSAHATRSGADFNAPLKAEFNINVSGTGNTEIREGVNAAIAQAFDAYSRHFLPDEVKRVVTNRWG